MFPWKSLQRGLMVVVIGGLPGLGWWMWQPSASQQLSVQSAWSWFSDPRAIVVDQYLLIGSVDQAGYSRVDVVELESNKITDSQRLSSRTERDDHNNLALLQLPGQRVLAAYARHGSDTEWFSRIGKMDPTKGSVSWDAEQAHTVMAKVTYSNLMKLDAEQGRIYNFFRGLNYNPCFSYSDDEGHSWSEAQFLMKIGQGRVRPYMKYLGNGQDRIDFLYTEAHPRNQNTSIYHCYYQAGKLHATDGKQIGSLPSSETPLNPLDGTRVFDGSSHPAWVWDLKRTPSGELLAAFVVSHDGAIGKDLRYYCATTTAEGWQTRMIAYAGSHLYEPENHYAGGIALHAADPQAVVISSNVDPATGQPLGHGVHRLYRGLWPKFSTEIIWKPIGGDGASPQLRPYYTAAAADPSVLLWLEGNYQAYTDFNTHVRWMRERTKLESNHDEN